MIGCDTHYVLRWLTTVLMDYNSPTSNYLKKCFKTFFFSLFNVCFKSFTIRGETMAKMNDRVPKERLDNGRLT